MSVASANVQPAPAPAPAAATCDNDAADPSVATLIDMGFTAAQARLALVEHPGNAEGALMWLLNRANQAKEARQAQVLAAAKSGTVTPAGFKATWGPVPRSPSVMHASPEPSRASRARHYSPQAMAVGLSPEKEKEATEPEDDSASQKMREMTLAGASNFPAASYVPKWRS